jgi:transposase
MSSPVALAADRRPQTGDEARARLVARNDQLEAENTNLRAETERQRKRIAELERKVEELRRKAKRQAAPFSREKPKRDPGRPGRKPGADYGRRAHRPAPEEVDEVLAAPLPGHCECGGEIALGRVAHQHQEELPKSQPLRRRFEVGVGHCRNCGRRHQGRHPLQTSDALGAAGSMLGPDAVALATQLGKELGLSPAKISQLFGEQFGISITPGGVVGAIARQARVLEPTYAALCEGVRASPVVAPDETGWRVDGSKAWLWAFVGSGLTVYLIAPGRGYGQAVEILGAEFSGTLERDGWAPYRRLQGASHQSCLAHLLRRCREMIADSIAGQARIPHTLRRILEDALALRAERERGTIDAAQLALRVGELKARAEQLLERNPTHRPNQRLLRHLTAEREHLFTFLTHDGVEATNWRAEQAIRPAVVNRKKWGGNRSWRGARAQEVAMSVIRTARRQEVDPIELMAAAQREPTPKAAAMLRIPTRASPVELEDPA